MCIGVVDASAKLILHKHEAKYLSYDVIVYGIFDREMFMCGASVMMSHVLGLVLEQPLRTALKFEDRYLGWKMQRPPRVR